MGDLHALLFTTTPPPPPHPTPIGTSSFLFWFGYHSYLGSSTIKKRPQFSVTVHCACFYAASDYRFSLLKSIRWTPPHSCLWDKKAWQLRFHTWIIHPDSAFVENFAHPLSNDKNVVHFSFCRVSSLSDENKLSVANSPSISSKKTSKHGWKHFHIPP